MHVIFTTNQKYYSKILRWLSKEPVSHVGVLFFAGEEDLLIDCTKPYGKLYAYKHWTTKHTPVCSVKVDLSPELELECFKGIRDRCVLRGYDWKAYWWGFFYLLRERFGIPRPEYNKNSLDRDVCTEVLVFAQETLLKAGVDITKVYFPSLTPGRMFDLLKKKGFVQVEPPKPV